MDASLHSILRLQKAGKSLRGQGEFVIEDWKHVAFNECMQFFRFGDGEKQSKSFVLFVVHARAQTEVCVYCARRNVCLMARHASEIQETVFLYLLIVPIVHIPHGECKRILNHL